MPALDRVRVLIVEDSSDDRTLYRRYLQGDPAAEYEFIECDRGEAGLEVCRREMPDVILIDYNLPDYDGVELLAELSRGRSGPIPAVMLTGHSSTSLAVESMRCGAQDYLSKDSVSRESIRRAVFHAREKVRLHIEIQRHQESLEAARIEAEESNQAKSRFLANMSHEIRTPMTAIVGFAETLSDPSLSESERDEAIQTIRSNGDHLLGLIDDILDLSKVEAGELELELRGESPLPLIRDSINMVRGRSEAEGLELQLEFMTDLPAEMLTDSTRYRQILINLLGNAIKFTETGTVLVIVVCGPDPETGEEMLHVSIADSGIGMTSDQTEKIFKPFTQADATTTRLFGGTGLGLSISSSLAERLGGSIECVSTPSRGSTFRVSVPTGAKPGGPRLSLEVCEGARELSPAPLNRDFDLSGQQILVADDTEAIRRLVGHFLRRAGAEVEFAADGREARDRALARWRTGEPYDVVLMDMQMPILDGHMAVQSLRAEAYPGVIIALTANAMESDRQECLDDGCNGFIPKPIAREDLLSLIATELGLRSTLA